MSSSPGGSRSRAFSNSSSMSKSSTDDEERADMAEPPPGEIRNNPKFLETERYFSRAILPPYDAVPKQERDVNLEELFKGRIYTRLMDAWQGTGWAEYDKVLGKGLYGSVHLGYKYEHSRLPHEDRQLCAIKRMPCYRQDSIGFKRKETKVIWTEVTIMRCLTHGHIVRLAGAYLLKPRMESKSAAYIIMEYCDAGTLHDEIQKQAGKVMPVPVARFYFRHVASGILYMHGKGICHGDLNCFNIMLKYKFDGVCKKCVLTDFGLSSICWSKPPPAALSDQQQPLPQPEYDQSSVIAGTVSSMAPERLRKVYLYPGDDDPFIISDWEKLTNDIWGLGNVLSQMVAGGTPIGFAPTLTFMGDNQVHDADTSAFLLQLYRENNTRLTAAQVWDNEWMGRESRDPGLEHDPNEPLY